MESEAFVRVILDMTDMLYRICCVQLSQKADREDAVQETLRKAWEKRRSLRDERYVKTWVIRILLNECHTIQRRMKRTLPLDTVPVAQKPQEEVELKEALLQLPEKYRIPLMLHYLEGHNVKDVAFMLHLPQGTVKTRLSRGRAMLKTILNEEVFEG